MWPDENPWPLIIVLATAAIGFLIAWSQKKRGWMLAGAIACLVLTAASWEYDQIVVTEREKVTEDVRGIVTAFQDRDLDRTLSYISNSARDLKLLAASAYNIVKLGPDTRITDIRVNLLPENQRAITTFRVNSTLEVQNGSNRMSTMWEARWQPEDGDWKMIDIIQCDPITGKQEPFPAELRRTLNSMYPQKP